MSNEVCPFNYPAFAYEHGHFTPAMFGFATHLTLAIWAEPEQSLPFDPEALMARFGQLPKAQFDDAVFCAFMVDDGAGLIYSRWVQKWAGRRQARRPISPEIKRTVRIRDMRKGRLTCAYCQADCTFDHEFDHVLPVSRGGINHAENIAIACRACNRKKGALTVEEFEAVREAHRG